jgi:ferredoxin
MPWVDESLCTGCGICVKECPVDAIVLSDSQRAVLNEQECVRCGICHDVCPQDAVRHDSERVPQEVAANLQWVRRLLENFHEPAERAAFMERMSRFFKKERKVAEQTLSAVAAAGENPTPALDAMIQALLGGSQSETNGRSGQPNG